MVWLALIAAAVVVALMTDSVAAWFVFLLLLLGFIGAGVMGDGIVSSSQHYRTAEVVRSGFPARKRFDDAPAEYDESAWEREKARRAADGRDST